MKHNDYDLYKITFNEYVEDCTYPQKNEDTPDNIAEYISTHNTGAIIVFKKDLKFFEQYGNGIKTKEHIGEITLPLYIQDNEEENSKLRNL